MRLGREGRSVPPSWAVVSAAALALVWGGVALVCSSADALADSSTSGATSAEQQQKIDALTQQIEQMKQEKAALEKKLKETEAKVPAAAPSPAAAASPVPPLSSP